MLILDHVNTRDDESVERKCRGLKAWKCWAGSPSHGGSAERGRDWVNASDRAAAEDKIPAEWGWESIWIPILVSFAALPFEVRRDVGSMYEVREDEAPIVEMLIAAGLCQNALYSSSNQPGRVQLPSAKMLSENSLSEH